MKPLTQIAALVRQSAHDAGFELAGIAPVQRLPELNYFPAWIAAGHAGEMKYLEARDEAGSLKRASLQTAAPWARSVIAFSCFKTFPRHMTSGIHLRPSFILITLALLLCASTLTAARSDEPHWLRITSGHFTVITDADQDKDRDALARFEQMRGVFGQLLMRTRVNMPEPIDIIALRSTDEYDKVAPLRQGQASAGAAFFIPGDDRNYFVLDISHEDAWRAISRELAHIFLDYNYPPTQPWFDEGFVEYFSSLRLDNKQGQIGGDPESFISLLSTEEWLATPALFTARGDASANAQGARHDLFHAQSWIVMHYLLNHNKLPDTGTYFDLVENQKVPVEDAMQKAYGVSAAQFAQAVKDHLHSLTQPQASQEKGQQPAAAGVQPIDVTAADQIGSNVEEVPQEQGQALLAEMRVRLPERREAAVAELESFSSQAKTDNAIVHRALAWVYLQNKEFDRGAEEINKGVEINPKDPWVHYYSALLKRRAADSSAGSIQGLPNMMLDLRIMLDWAPEFAEARAMLAMAQLEGGGANAAMDTMRIAIRLAPRNQTYLLNMAQIYLAGKHWDAATALLEQLKKSPDPKIVKSANDQLEALPMLKKYGVAPQLAAKAESPGTTSAPASSSVATVSATAPLTKAKAAEPPAEKQNPPPEQAASSDAAEPPAPPQPDMRPIQHLKGKLIAVDCAQAPSAVLTVSAGTRRLQLRTENYKALMLIGADEFSCAWTARSVAINYRAGGKADGDLVSVELQ